jgi:hypothetical protein
MGQLEDLSLGLWIISPTLVEGVFYEVCIQHPV